MILGPRTRWPLLFPSQVLHYFFPPFFSQVELGKSSCACQVNLTSCACSPSRPASLQITWQMTAYQVKLSSQLKRWPPKNHMCKLFESPPVPGGGIRSHFLPWKKLYAFAIHSMVHCVSAFAPGASGLPYYCASICARFCCTWRASSVDSKPKTKKKEVKIDYFWIFLLKIFAGKGCNRRSSCVAAKY